MGSLDPLGGARAHDRLAARDDALGGCGREPGRDQFDHHLGGEAVRDHDRLGAAVGHEASSFRVRRAGLLLGAIEQK